MSVDDIRDVYAEQADRMERFDWLNRLLTGRFREGLFGQAEGRVLDVAAGLGTNVEYLPESVSYVGVDISPDMLEKAELRYERLERGDTLLEMDRVAAPDGRILLLEHGRSSIGPFVRFQDWRAEAHYESEGCRRNQEPVDLVRSAGLAIHDVTTGPLGVLAAIEAGPNNQRD